MAENARVSKLAVFRKNIVKFFKDVRAELKKVIWPTKEQLTNNTVTVLLMCFLVGAIIWIADWLLTEVVKWTLAR
jgi:preprotein translocase subunit SecE